MASEGADFAQLWRQADAALYAAKALGRNRVEWGPQAGATP
jgi:PleD family two-component response regulator